MSETLQPPAQARAVQPETPPEQMQAIVHTRFGPPETLELQRVDTPVPKEGQVLVKVEASSINAADHHNVHGVPFILRLFLPLFKLNMGIRKPKEPMLGADLAGRIVAVGPNVTKYHPGDEVFGVCTKGSGSYAEYACARADRLSSKPPNVSAEQAGAVGIAATTALQALRNQGKIQMGHKVLINGAGGGVGTYAVQIAKAFGAEVTAVTNTENLGLVRQLGADHVIDYTKEDYTKQRDSYDLICEIAASHSFGTYKRVLKPNGTFVLVGMKDKIFARLIYFSLMRPLLGRGDKKFHFFIAKINEQDLDLLRDLLESGKLVSVIDSRYSLKQVADAFRRFEEGRVRGKIVVAPGKDSESL